jgi:hypothetical protein
MFKDKVNRWLTTGLFKETAVGNKDFAIMTLEEGRQRFVDLADMTGYKFSQKYLGGYSHWKALEASSFAPHIEDWREELEVKIRCEGLERISQEASEGHYQANKFLVDRGWDTRSAGRPTKLEVEKKVKRDAKVVEAAKRFLTPLN